MLKQFLSATTPVIPLAIAEFSGKEFLIWVGILFFIIGGANAVIDLWNKVTHGLKETPPPASTYQTLSMCQALHEQTKEEQRQVAAQFNARMKGFSDKIDVMSTNMNTQFQNILRSIGRLEGRTQENGHDDH